MTDDARAVYSERARLVAFLASRFPCAIAYNDTAEPDWPVVYIRTPRGQLSWHLHPDDLPLFDGIAPIVKDADHPLAHLTEWDRHTNEQKYERLQQLARWDGHDWRAEDHWRE